MKRLIPVILILITLFACEKEQILEGDIDSSSNFKTVNYLNKKARNLSKDNPEEAIELAKKALLVSEEIVYLEGQKQSHNTLYFIYLNQLNDIDKAQYHEKAFSAIDIEMDKVKDLAYANYQKGYTLYKQNKLAESLPYLFEAKDMFRTQGQLKNEAYALYAISKVFEKIGKYEQGLSYLNQASFESIDESFLWSAYYHKGILLVKLNKFKEAKSAYLESHTLIKKLNKPSKEMMVLNDLARVNVLLDEYDKSDLFIDKGIAIAEVLNDSNFLFQFYLKRGFRYQKENRFDEAIIWNKKAELIADELQNVEYGAMALLALSHCYYERNEITDAIRTAKEGVTKSENFNNETRKDLLNNYSFFSGLVGDSVAYYKYQGKLKDISLNDYATSQKVAVTKAELAYKEKTELAKYDTYIEDVRKEIAEDERQGKFYLMGFGFLCAFIILLLAMRKPAQFFYHSTERIMFLIEELQAGFKKRLAGEGPPLPEMAPLKKPEPPDERDIHNLWRKDRHGRKGDKDKGKDDPAPGLDDE